MKKAMSFLVASFLIASAQVGAEIATSAAPATQAKEAVLNVAVAPKAEQSAPQHDYALESFACCGLPQ